MQSEVSIVKVRIWNWYKKALKNANVFLLDESDNIVASYRIVDETRSRFTFFDIDISDFATPSASPSISPSLSPSISTTASPSNSPSSSMLPTPSPSKSPSIFPSMYSLRAQKVKIQHDQSDRAQLIIREVEIYDLQSGTNQALKKPASQSSTWRRAAYKAVNGSKGANDFSMTRSGNGELCLLFTCSVGCTCCLNSQF